MTVKPDVVSLYAPCAPQTGIVYYMVDLAPEASRFFTFLFIMFLVSATQACVALELRQRQRQTAGRHDSVLAYMQNACHLRIS